MYAWCALVCAGYGLLICTCISVLRHVVLLTSLVNANVYWAWANVYCLLASVDLFHMKKYMDWCSCFSMLVFHLRHQLDVSGVGAHISFFPTIFYKDLLYKLLVLEHEWKFSKIKLYFCYQAVLDCVHSTLAMQYWYTRFFQYDWWWLWSKNIIAIYICNCVYYCTTWISVAGDNVWLLHEKQMCLTQEQGKGHSSHR